MAFDLYQKTSDNSVHYIGRIYTPDEMSRVASSEKVDTIEQRIKALEDIHAAGNDFDTRLAQVNLDVTQIQSSNSNTSASITQMQTLIGA